MNNMISSYSRSLSCPELQRDQVPDQSHTVYRRSLSLDENLFKERDRHFSYDTDVTPITISDREVKKHDTAEARVNVEYLGSRYDFFLAAYNLAMASQSQLANAPDCIESAGKDGPKNPVTSIAVGTSNSVVPPTPQRVETYGEVSLRINAGIQAINNNCALAAFFMAMSNNRLLDKLIDEIGKKINKTTTADEPEKMQRLQKLTALCQRFCFDQNTSPFIPDATDETGPGLDELRKLYNISNSTQLDPEEFIRCILFDIYDNPETAVNHLISWLNIHDDNVVISKDYKPSNNFDETIPHPNYKDGLTFDPEQEFSLPDPHDPRMEDHYTGYKKGDQPALRVRERINRESGFTESIKYEFLADKFNQAKTMEYHFEPHIIDKTSFVRSSSRQFINPEGQRMLVDLLLKGYSKDAPYSGQIKTEIIRRAKSFNELINNWIDYRKSQPDNDVAPSEYTDRPEVLWVTMPNHGNRNRLDLDCLSDVTIPSSDGGEIHYEVSGILSVERAHYLAWTFPDKTCIHYADSMGMTDSDATKPMRPIVISMPSTGTEDALQAAHQASRTRYEHDAFSTARDRLASLRTSPAMVILKRKTTPPQPDHDQSGVNE